MKCTSLCLAAALSSSTMAGEFQPSDILDWKMQAFQGQTDYTLVEASDTDAQHTAVRASCGNATASGLVLERKHDLKDAPILEWRWRVDSIYSGLDETTKGGDDYPARLYVVAERWPAFRSRAINYVWASSQPAGTTWSNAFAKQFMMVAVRSGKDGVGKWMTERRNVLDDFKRLHEFEPDEIDALAIMTDCDNAGQSATAWYGPIQWIEENEL